MTAQPEHDPRDTAGLLEALRDQTRAAREMEVAIVRDVVAWAQANTVASAADAATISDGRIDTGVPIAGQGAPLVSEFALMELCAVLGRSTASGREYVGKVLEIAYRLPELWDAVIHGVVPVWRALVIADKTRLLPAEAAAHVDHHLAGFAATCTWAQIDRLVEEALVRFDPAAAEERRREAAEARRFDIDTEAVGFEGTVHVDGQLDVADALDLDAAIARRATALGDLGCEDSLDVRRAKAAGELARADQMLDLDIHPADAAAAQEPGSGSRADDQGPDAAHARRVARSDEGAQRVSRRPGRKVDLHVHLTDAALRGVSASSTAGEVARLGNTRTPISPEQIREWCGTPGTTVIVRPVTDVAGHEPIEAYEIPERHRRQVALRDPHCRFPHCNRRAERCDADHARPHARGGSTCPCNEVPLCRGHHRAKTNSTWGYTVLDPGSYLWTSPHGHQFLVDHRGTRALDKPNRRCPAEPPDH